MTNRLQRTGANLLLTHRRLIRAHAMEGMPGAFATLLADPIQRVSDTLEALIEAPAESGTVEDTPVSPGEGTGFNSPAPPSLSGASVRRAAEAFAFTRPAGVHFPAAAHLPQPASPREAPRFRHDAASARAALPALTLGPDVESTPLARAPVPVPEAEENSQRQKLGTPSLPITELPRIVPLRPPGTVAALLHEPAVPPPAQPLRTQAWAASRTSSRPNPSPSRAGTVPSPTSRPLSTRRPVSFPVAAEHSHTRMALGAPALAALLQANIATTQSAPLAAEELNLHAAAAVFPKAVNAAPQRTPSFTVSSPLPISAMPAVEAVFEELEQRLRLELLRAYGTSGA